VRHEINQRFAGKFNPSDVVQQTLMEAWQGWDGMQAQEEAQRQAWLRKVLANQLAHFVRHYQGVKKRDLTRELSIEQSLHRSAERIEGLLVAQGPSPSQFAVVNEQRAMLADAMEQLPDAYRQVILLRSVEELSHQEVAKRMGRTEPAVRMLWLRALAALAEEVKTRASRQLGESLPPYQS